MSDKKDRTAERIARQIEIDDACVSPVWSEHVESQLIKSAMQDCTVRTPMILLPELRFRSMLMKMSQMISGTAKIMVVDESGTRFDSMRQCVENSPLSFFYSEQPAAKLNYTDESFHCVIAEMGMVSLGNLESLLASYRRVLKSDGKLAVSIPLEGSFPAYYDMFEECLCCLCPEDRSSMMHKLRDRMHAERFIRVLESSGFSLDSHQTACFELEFPSVDQMLFSTLVESHFLGYCLNLSNPNLESRSLLTSLVRSFNKYFQGEKIRMPFKAGIFSAHKA